MRSRNTDAPSRRRGGLARAAGLLKRAATRRDSLESKTVASFTSSPPPSAPQDRVSRTSTVGMWEDVDTRSASRYYEKNPPSPIRLNSAFHRSYGGQVGQGFKAARAHPMSATTSIGRFGSILFSGDTVSVPRGRGHSKSPALSPAADIIAHIVTDDLKGSVERSRREVSTDPPCWRVQHDEDIARHELHIEEMEAYSALIQKMMTHRVLQVKAYQQRLDAEEKMWLALQNVHAVIEKEEERRNLIVSKESVDRRNLTRKVDGGECSDEEEPAVEINPGEWISYAYPLQTEKLRIQESAQRQRMYLEHAIAIHKLQTRMRLALKMLNAARIKKEEIDEKGHPTEKYPVRKSNTNESLLLWNSWDSDLDEAMDQEIYELINILWKNDKVSHSTPTTLNETQDMASTQSPTKRHIKADDEEPEKIKTTEREGIINTHEQRKNYKQRIICREEHERDKIMENEVNAMFNILRNTNKTQKEEIYEDANKEKIQKKIEEKKKDEYSHEIKENNHQGISDKDNENSTKNNSAETNNKSNETRIRSTSTKVDCAFDLHDQFTDDMLAISMDNATTTETQDREGLQGDECRERFALCASAIEGEEDASRKDIVCAYDDCAFDLHDQFTDDMLAISMDNVTTTETQDREGLQGDECRERFALCASAIEGEEDASRKDIVCAYDDCAFDLHDQFTDDMLAISMDNVTATETQDREGLQGDECRERFALCASAIEGEEDASRKDIVCAYDDCAFDLHDQFTDDMLAISMDNVTTTETQDREGLQGDECRERFALCASAIEGEEDASRKDIVCAYDDCAFDLHDQFTDDMLAISMDNVTTTETQDREGLQGDECRERFALCASAIEGEEDASRKDIVCAYDDCAFDLHDQFTDDMLAISMDNATTTETQDPKGLYFFAETLITFSAGESTESTFGDKAGDVPYSGFDSERRGLALGAFNTYGAGTSLQNDGLRAGEGVDSLRPFSAGETAESTFGDKAGDVLYSGFDSDRRGLALGAFNTYGAGTSLQNDGLRAGEGVDASGSFSCSLMDVEEDERILLLQEEDRRFKRLLKRFVSRPVNDLEKRRGTPNMRVDVASFTCGCVLERWVIRNR
ncbi:hypothetical protein, conserved [Trypanosoma brucei brucei TREU927]|uniref:DUF1663 domain-containing protein n=1 Tax=Trypanosoma brucei brucei (strain 927/4 GUTat10.1) TaxID=185431 RepID=Q57XP1_TRYB2|nr:hypothetical protein, conserved [Trypanosoma brucei brucei TREU927]AAX69628.1 hypothetical protein, conserved [Trypanosoma brucei]AAZ12297.1 hypothetical protein, conserved [Trypanosoma brucei brucei TREU927]